MIRSLFVGVTAGVLLLVAGCQKVELQEFSPDGTFKVLMPGKTEEKSMSVAGLTAKMWMAEYRDGAFFVVRAAVPGGNKMSQSEQQMRLRQGQAGAIANVKGTLLIETETKLQDKYPGRRFEARVKVPKTAGGEAEGKLKARIFFAEDKLYMVYAVGTPEWIGGPETDRFLDSFQVLK